MLSNFLNRYPHIVSVIEGSEVNSPLFSEIRVRVSDQEAWVHCLKKLTRAFPFVIFSKRYQTIGERFGYSWSVILFGPRDTEALQTFCDEADVVVSTVISAPEVKAEESSNEVEESAFYKGTKKLYDKNGKEFGEETIIKLPGTDEAYRSDYKGNTPRVFPAIQGGGEELNHLKQYFKGIL